MKRRIIFTANGLVGSNSDVEIIEKHHNKKVDAPSGTAIMLGDVIDPRHEMLRCYGRNGESLRKKELGIHSIRGGNIFGEHSVIFAMEDEVIEIKHTAFSKKIFAKGAINAAKWLYSKDIGYYDIDDVFK